MTKDIAVIILAAGKGTRMKSPRHKVMHTVAGKSLISHVLKATSNLNPSYVVAVLSDDMQDVQNEVKNVFPHAEYAIQNEQLGTAHAVLQAGAIDGDIALILYGDTPFIQPETMCSIIEKLCSDDSCAVVVLGFTPENPAHYGRIIVDNNDELSAIVEYKEASDEIKKIGLCNSGVMAIRGKYMQKLISSIGNDNAKGEYYLTDIVSIAKENGFTCKFVKTDDENEVMGINSQEELAIANNVMQNKLRVKAMENGVMMIAPETVFLSCDTKFGEGVVIHQNVVFGDGVIIGNNVEIKSFTHIDGSRIHDEATIGPFARIRPDAIIGNGAKIGNFVEVKKSYIGDGAKISHLTYIGDATIGKNANIGAGTVTCNYDGYNKFKTEIGEGAFIGSNSSIVAPVTIGDNAIVGAGSTITKDVEENAIAVNERKQKNIKGKAKTFRNKRVKK